MDFLKVSDSVTVSRKFIQRMYVIQEADIYSIIIECVNYKYALEKVFPTMDAAQKELEELSDMLNRGDDALSTYSTQELICELCQRSGVSEMPVDAGEKKKIRVLGPADILVIADG